MRARRGGVAGTGSGLALPRELEDAVFGPFLQQVAKVWLAWPGRGRACATAADSV